MVKNLHFRTFSIYNRFGSSNSPSLVFGAPFLNYYFPSTSLQYDRDIFYENVKSFVIF